MTPTFNRCPLCWMLHSADFTCSGRLAQPLPIAGYTSQTDLNVKRVNANKELEERVMRVLDAHRAEAAYDQRFVSMAISHVQEAFMCLNRAVFKPERIRLPEDVQP